MTYMLLLNCALKLVEEIILNRSLNSVNRFLGYTVASKLDGSQTMAGLFVAKKE